MRNQKLYFNILNVLLSVKNLNTYKYKIIQIFVWIQIINARNE